MLPETGNQGRFVWTEHLWAILTFVSTWYNLKSRGRGNPNWRTAFIRLVCGYVSGALCGLLIDVGGVAHSGQYHFQGGGPGWPKKTSGADASERASKHHTTVVSASVPALTPHSNGLWPLRPISPFLSQIGLAWAVSSEQQWSKLEPGIPVCHGMLSFLLLWWSHPCSRW